LISPPDHQEPGATLTSKEMKNAVEDAVKEAVRGEYRKC
jgi:hypothetical protein